MATFVAGLPFPFRFGVVVVAAGMVVVVRPVAEFDLMVVLVVDLQLQDTIVAAAMAIVVRPVAEFDLMVVLVVVRPVAEFDLGAASVVVVVDLRVVVVQKACFQIQAYL